MDSRQEEDSATPPHHPVCSTIVHLQPTRAPLDAAVARRPANLGAIRPSASASACVWPILAPCILTRLGDPRAIVQRSARCDPETREASGAQTLGGKQQPRRAAQVGWIDSAAASAAESRSEDEAAR